MTHNNMCTQGPQTTATRTRCYVKRLDKNPYLRKTAEVPGGGAGGSRGSAQVPSGGSGGGPRELKTSWSVPCVRRARHMCKYPSPSLSVSRSLSLYLSLYIYRERERHRHQYPGLRSRGPSDRGASGPAAGSIGARTRAGGPTWHDSVAYDQGTPRPQESECAVSGSYLRSGVEVI